MLLGEGDAATSIEDGTLAETIDRKGGATSAKGVATTPSTVEREEEKDKKR